MPPPRPPPHISQPKRPPLFSSPVSTLAHDKKRSPWWGAESSCRRRGIFLPARWPPRAPRQESNHRPFLFLPSLLPVTISGAPSPIPRPPTPSMLFTISLWAFVVYTGTSGASRFLWMTETK
uniref:Uncharacterized protein n=1 Tax=Poecilia latipinna TaxID=48699 RepID=A0A3B3UL59_9TELE